MKYKILQYPDKNLTTCCTEIELPLDKKWWAVSKEMGRLLKKHSGKGLAANQVGILKRMFIMNSMGRVNTFINPVIRRQWGINSYLKEYCLSHPRVEKEKMRWSHLNLTWVDLFGKEQSGDFEGFDAQCIQHEMDHLNGINFLKVSPSECCAYGN